MSECLFDSFVRLGVVKWVLACVSFILKNITDYFKPNANESNKHTVVCFLIFSIVDSIIVTNLPTTSRNKREFCLFTFHHNLFDESMNPPDANIFFI